MRRLALDLALGFVMVGLLLAAAAGEASGPINDARPASYDELALDATSGFEGALFGSGKSSLRQIDPGSSPDIWRNYIRDLAGRPSTASLKNGVEDVVGTFPKAGGGGTFQFGIRIAPGPNGTWDLVTLLTKQ